MAAATLKGLIAGLYSQLMEQRRLVQEQESNILFLKEADILISVEQAIGCSMRAEVEKLEASQSKHNELERQLNEVIHLWRDRGHEAIEGQSWLNTQTSASLSSGSSTMAAPYSAVGGNHPFTPGLNDPAVGSRARYESQWQKRSKGLTVNPLQLSLAHRSPPSTEMVSDTSSNIGWWMDDDETQCALLPLPYRQARMDDTARAATFKRPARFFQPPPLHRSFGREIGVGARNRGYRMAPGDFEDEDFDPNFWQTRLQYRGDIFSDRFMVSLNDGGSGSASRQTDGFELLSPRSVPVVSSSSPAATQAETFGRAAPA